MFELFLIEYTDSRGLGIACNMFINFAAASFLLIRFWGNPQRCSTFCERFYTQAPDA
jgi:hypothetical protein